MSGASADKTRTAGGTTIVAETEADPPPPVRLWGGRFESGPADALARLSVSVQFDWRLAPYDLLASAAHARVLHKAGLLTDAELDRMVSALDQLGRACREGRFRPAASDEDVHTALERGLLEQVGSLGGKLRAGRSRNDQIATDLRLYLRDHARLIAARLIELENALIGQAERHSRFCWRTSCSRTSRRSAGTRAGCATGTSAPR
jgi:argininosuccinate lyase